MRKRRIPPPKREQKKTKNSSSIKKGQKIKLLGDAKAKVRVIRQPKARDNSVVVRIKRTFTSIPKKTLFGRGHLIIERKKLIKQMHNADYGSIKAAELEGQIRAIDKKLKVIEEMTHPRTVTTNVTEKIPIKRIQIKANQKPKRQKVSKIERQKQRRKTLIEQARKKYTNGTNPKRLQRELTRKGIKISLDKITKGSPRIGRFF